MIVIAIILGGESSDSVAITFLKVANPTLLKPKYQFHGEMGGRQIEQGFSSFFAIFHDFSKWRAPKALCNFEKSSNMTKIWQKMKKRLVQLAFNPFFG